MARPAIVVSPETAVKIAAAGEAYAAAMKQAEDERLAVVAEEVDAGRITIQQAATILNYRRDKLSAALAEFRAASKA